MINASPLGLFVTGTDTGVGKTVVTSGLARRFSDLGRRVHVMKPAETGYAGLGYPDDARRLSEAARQPCDRDTVPYVFAEALAPAVAATRAQHPIDVAVLQRAFERKSRGCDILLVEGAGGLAVPLTAELDMLGLCQLWNLPLLIVCRPDLGTLNHTQLTVEYARQRGVPIVGLVISGMPMTCDDVAQQTNPAVLEERAGVPLWGCLPASEHVETPDGAAQAALCIDLDLLEARLRWLRDQSQSPSSVSPSVAKE